MPNFASANHCMRCASVGAAAAAGAAAADGAAACAARLAQASGSASHRPMPFRLSVAPQARSRSRLAPALRLRRFAATLRAYGDFSDSHRCNIRRINQLSPLVARWPNDGGRSSAAAPNRLFGVSLITNASVPPAASSAWLIQLFVHGLPFQLTDWM